MEELRKAAHRALLHPKFYIESSLITLTQSDSWYTLWTEISARKALVHSEVCEDLLVVQGYFKAWGSRPLSESDENAVNELYGWANRVACPSSIFAEAVDLEDLPEGKKTIIKENKLESALAVAVLASLSALLPLWKTANAADTVVALASFTSAADPWTSEESLSSSTETLKLFTTECDPWPLIERILREKIKPLFARTKNPHITPSGRKNFHPIPRPRFDSSTFDPENKPWKFREVHATTVFAWIISQYSARDREELESHFPLLIPPLLALIDDESLSLKARGCDILTILLKAIRESKSDILKRTNLSSVFEDALKPCFLSIPSITPEDDSIRLLALAYPAFLALLQESYRFSARGTSREILQAKEAYRKGTTSLLRDNLIPSFHHISTMNPVSESEFSIFASFPHPRLSALLLDQICTVVTELAFHTTKYLQDLVPPLHGTLSNPFGTAFPRLLFAAIAATRAVMLNAHPRLWRWRAEILSGITSCWIHVLQEEDRIAEGVPGGGNTEADRSDSGSGPPRETLEKLKKELRGLVYLLRAVLENPSSIVNGESGVIEAKESFPKELEALARADSSLTGLFVSIDPKDGSYFGMICT